MNVFKKYNLWLSQSLLWPFFFLVATITSGCQEKATTLQAKKQLKAFDGELLSIVDQLSGSDAYFALEALVNIGELPLPLMSLVQSKMGQASYYDFEGNKGVYDVDSSNVVRKIGRSDSIIIQYSYGLEREFKASLILSSYKEAYTKWGTMMPTQIQLDIINENRRLLQLDVLGQVKYEIPTKYNVNVKFDDYVFEGTLRTRLNKRKGRFYFNSTFCRGKNQLIEVDVFQKHNISNPDWARLEYQEIEMRVFPLTFKASINDKLIDPSTFDFVAELNAHSTIEVFSQLNDLKLADVELLAKEGEGKLNYAFLFGNHETVFAEDILIVYRHIMNIRFPDIGLTQY